MDVCIALFTWEWAPPLKFNQYRDVPADDTIEL